MSKAVRWQVPFVSVSGTKYRVDIYDETGSWSGVTQLLPGDQPFVTDEDASDDYFAPVRSQSGTLQVCTKIEPQTTYPIGGTLSLNDILPANNIAHPVRLVSIAANNAETIEWQGFLSCEAYNQDYVGIPQNLSLSLISVLEAMDSVQLDPLTTNSLKYAYRHIYDALHEIEVQCGLSCFTSVRYPMTDWRIFNKYIDATVFFERKEYNNENSTTYIVSGLSCKTVIERLATYMGWTVRENKTEVLFERLGENLGMFQQSLWAFGNTFHPVGTPSAQFAVKDLDTDVEWRGIDHQLSVVQGAKSVEVIAHLEKYEIESSLPAFPYGDVEAFYRKYSYSEWIYIVANKNLSAYSHLSYKFYKGTINIPQNIQTYDGERTLQDVFASMIAVNPEIVDINIETQATPPTRTEITAGAFLAQVAYEDQQQSGHTTNDGLYVVWMPQAWNTSSHYVPSTGYYVDTYVYENLAPIFKITNPLSVRIPNGYLKLSAAMTHIVYEYDNYEDFGVLSKSTNWQDKLLFHIKVGNKYWTGSGWSSSATKVWIDIDGTNFKKNWTPQTPVAETDGYLIPVDSQLTGNIEIAIYAPIHAMDQGFKLLAETFFTSLDLEYIKLSDSTLTDRSENHYYRLLGTNFRDEISVGTELASMLNNQPSPSLIMDNSTTPMKTLDYLVSGGTESRRPEVDLLNRLAAYYGAARQRLELEMAHPTAAPLPLLKLNGINDGKVYLPLSESRDWQTGVCKLTCFETPT